MKIEIKLHERSKSSIKTVLLEIEYFDIYSILFEVHILFCILHNLTVKGKNFF